MKNNIYLLKQREDLLNNFEKNYIKISEHEKIINDLVKEKKEKLEKEYKYSDLLLIEIVLKILGNILIIKG